MRDLQEKKRWKKYMQSPIMIGVLLIIVVLLINSDYNIYKTNQITKMNREESEKKLALLQDNRDRLIAELERLKTERGVEEELRNKFQITKLGEEVLVVVDEVSDKKPEVSDNKSYWDSFLDFFTK
ncbi:MAG: hypothetical protein Q7S19_00260 [bacterium]|nr:hypothetical protein [bacterium]